MDALKLGERKEDVAGEGFPKTVFTALRMIFHKILI